MTLIILPRTLNWYFVRMNNKNKKLISVAVLLISAFVSLFFVSKKTISFSNSSNQKVVPVASATDKIQNTVSILFVGDIMFDRYIRQVTDRHGYAFPFQKVESLLRDNDLAVANLEGPITNSQSVSLASKMGEKNNYIFTFDPKVGQALVGENIKLVNIGNNHITNFGSNGIESTRNYLMQAGVGFFGDPEKSDGRIAFENIKGLKIAFVNYNQFILNAQQKTIEDINKSKKANADIIIVYTHWGKEFVDKPDQKIQDLAHEFIDAGVDLIIGSHPHVVQTKEEYKGKMIYYSLGNFIFDQYFDLHTREGMIVLTTINTSSKEIEAKEFQVKMDSNGQTTYYK